MYDSKDPSKTVSRKFPFFEISSPTYVSTDSSGTVLYLSDSTGGGNATAFTEYPM